MLRYLGLEFVLNGSLTLLVAAAQAIDVATLALRRASGPAVAQDVGGALDAGQGRGSLILKILCRVGGAASPRREPGDLVDAVESVQAHPHLVPNVHGLRRLGRVAIHPHVTGAAGRSGLAARLREPHRPHPTIHPHAHAPSLPRSRLLSPTLLLAARGRKSTTRRSGVVELRPLDERGPGPGRMEV